MINRNQKYSDEWASPEFTQPVYQPEVSRMSEDASRREIADRQNTTQNLQQIRARGEDGLFDGVMTAANAIRDNKRFNVENERANQQQQLQVRADQRQQQVADREKQMHDKFGEREAEARVAANETQAKLAQSQTKIAENQVKESEAEREFYDGLDTSGKTRRQVKFEAAEKDRQLATKINETNLALSKTQDARAAQQMKIELAKLQLERDQHTASLRGMNLDNDLKVSQMYAAKTAAKVSDLANRMRVSDPNGLMRVMTPQEIAANFPGEDAGLTARAAREAGMNEAQLRMIQFSDPAQVRKFEKRNALVDKSETFRDALKSLKSNVALYKQSLIDNTTDKNAKNEVVKALRTLGSDKAADDIESGRMFANALTLQSIDSAMDEQVKIQSEQVKRYLADNNRDIGDPDVQRNIAEIDSLNTFGHNVNPFLNNVPSMPAINQQMPPLGQPQIPGFNPAGMKQPAQIPNAFKFKTTTGKVGK